MPRNDDEPDIVATSSRIVYENRWMRVREDAIRRRDGSPGIYGVVEKDDFVVVVPVHEDGRQVRHVVFVARRCHGHQQRAGSLRSSGRHLRADRQLALSRLQHRHEWQRDAGDRDRHPWPKRSVHHGRRGTARRNKKARPIERWNGFQLWL